MVENVFQYMEVTPTDGDVTSLFAEADELYSSLYPEESNHPAFSDSFLEYPSILIGAIHGQTLIGTGGVIVKNKEWGELKRMYVKKQFRRMGAGGHILQMLFDWSRCENIKYLRLETGALQPEAIFLYKHYGFYEIPPFDGYIEDPNSVFYEYSL